MLKWINRYKFNRKRFIFLGGLIILWFLFPWISPGAYYISLANRIGIFAIVVIGYNLLCGNTGQFSFGHAALVGIGAYTSAMLSVKLGLNFVFCFVSAAILTSVAGYIIGLSSIRLGGWYLAMATAAFNFIFSTVVWEWRSFAGGEAGISPVSKPVILGLPINTEVRYFYLVWITVLLILAFTGNVLRGRIGRALMAVREDETAAAVTGIDTVRVKLNAFALSALFAGIGGSFLAHYLTFINPRPFHVGLSVQIFVMAMIGGFGSAWGSVLGAALLILLPEILRLVAGSPLLPYKLSLVFSDYNYHLLVYGVLMFIAVVYLPRGLAGIKWRKRLKGGGSGL